MSKTTIENSSKGYILRCETCAEAYELATVDRSMPLWAFKALVKGFEEEHSDCIEPKSLDSRKFNADPRRIVMQAKKQTFRFGAIVTLSVEADDEGTAQALADKAMQSFEVCDDDDEGAPGCMACGYSFGNVERDGQQHDYCVACAENAEAARDAH